MKRPSSFYPIVLLMLLATLGLASLPACRKDTGKEERKKPAAETQPGVVIASKNAQEAGGIRTAPLVSMTFRKEIKAYGMVLDLQDLFSARNRVARAKAEVERTSAELEVSQKAYERQKTLYGEAQDVSAKSLQAAEAAWQSAKASASAARSALEAEKEGARQQWGTVIAEWLMRPSPEFESLSRHQAMLIRLTLPSDAAVASGPGTVAVRTAGGRSAAARLVSSSPSTDPRIQGMSFFYLAAARPDLVSGMNVEAALPSGPGREGVLVPSAAVVWQEGKPWAYVQEGGDRFVRRQVPGEDPVAGGYFTTTGFTAGERVVVEGAQVLLSMEYVPVRREEED